MLNFKKSAVALAVAATFAVPAMAAVTISNPYLDVGVSDHGTLGSNGGTEPGILYDPSGTSNYGINDILTPGDPFEGFYVTANTASGGPYQAGNNNDGGGYCATGGSCGAPAFTTITGPTATSATAANWSGTDGTLNVTNSYSLGISGGKNVIAVTTTLTNVSGGALSNVEFLRTLDPDPDVNTDADFTTYNTASGSQACGTGTATNQTICITDVGSAYTSAAGIGGPTADTSFWTNNPADYLSGALASYNGGTADWTIGLAYDIGSLANGATATLTYDYVVGATLAIASGGGGGTTVPEPSSLALVGLGLLGLSLTRRKPGRV